VRVTVTGAGGLLGSNLASEFSREGHQVTALYRRHGLRLPGITAVSCDLTNGAELSRVLVEARPDWIVHCAAATDLDWCEAHSGECLRINAAAPAEIAAQARTLGAGMIYVSTDAVFDGVLGGYREMDAPAPVSQYGHSKALGETLVRSALPEAVILRTNLYGWNLQPKTSLAEWALRLLRKGLTVPGFCDVVFSPVLVNRLAEWMLVLMSVHARGIFHAASSDHASKYDFLRELAAAFGLDAALVRESSIEDSPLRAPRPRNTWLRAEKLAAAVGGGLPTIRQGLEAFRVLDETGFAGRLRAAAA
jgi:dTDP-4-dehydrorhamnose reductase